MEVEGTCEERTNRLIRWYTKNEPKESNADPLAYFSKWIIPVNIGNYHWALMVVRVDTREIHFYDSMPNPEIARERMANTLKFIDALALATGRHDLVSSVCKWSCEMKGSPSQYKDGTDCGLFVILNAELEVLGNGIEGGGTAQGKFIPTFATRGDFGMDVSDGVIKCGVLL